jgi:hypothetical protein
MSCVAKIHQPQSCAVKMNIVRQVADALMVKKCIE